jgi:predicted RNA polymerase sigma factor
MQAALYAEIGQSENAKLTYQKGLELAKNQKNTKTLLELQRAYQMFLDDEED